MNTSASDLVQLGPAGYQGQQAFGMTGDMIHPAVMTDGLKEDESWVPQSENVWFKPLMLNVSQGYFLNLLRVRKSGILSCHRHSGPVHAFVLKGRWYYLEHDWVAEEGGYAFEPPGEIHTLYVPEDVPEMITHVSCYRGLYLYRPGWKAYRLRRRIHENRLLPAAL